ncbi:MAG: hypothetical protein MK193_14310, partial [Lentisphaeria bacterium]|nr:hypothetical protein [Lentisphaeria bacterium]
MFQGLLQKQLAQAIKDQSLFKIKSLLMAGVKPDEENEVLGSSAIDYATHKGYTQITNLLLSKAGYDKLTSKHIEELVH